MGTTSVLILLNFIQILLNFNEISSEFHQNFTEFAESVGQPYRSRRAAGGGLLDCRSSGEIPHSPSMPQLATNFGSALPDRDEARAVVEGHLPAPLLRGSFSTLGVPLAP